MSNYDDYDDYEDYADYTDPDLTRHKKCDTVKWVLTLVGFILVAVMLVGIICGWFTPKETPTTSEPEVTESGTETGGLYIPETENGTGISLVSAVIPVSQYEEYGVMPIAESAQTLTATVQPDNNAENTKVKWEASFKNPASSWAEGKTVSDYLTLSFGDEYKTSKTCVVSCLQAFGEQIEIAVVAVDNPVARATVSVDYVQKVSDITLSFGTVNCVWSGNTDVKLEVNERGEGTGGMPNLSVSYAQGDYTIGADVQTTYTLSVADGYSDEDSNGEFLHYSYAGGFGFQTVRFNGERANYAYGCFDFSTYDVANKGLRFALKFMHENMSFGCYSVAHGCSDGGFSSLSEAVVNYYNGIGDWTLTNAKLFKLTVNVKNHGQEMTKETTFNATGYTNISTVTGLNVDQSQLYY